MDHGCIAIIIAQAVFLPAVHAIDFLHKRFIVQIVKVQAANVVFSMIAMRICMGDSVQASTQAKHIAIGYLMF